MAKPPGYFEQRDAADDGAAGKEVAQRVRGPRLVAAPRLPDCRLEFCPLVRVERSPAVVCVHEIAVTNDASQCYMAIDRRHDGGRHRDIAPLSLHARPEWRQFGLVPVSALYSHELAAQPHIPGLEVRVTEGKNFPNSQTTSRHEPYRNRPTGPDFIDNSPYSPSVRQRFLVKPFRLYPRHSN
ncbi:hypothetical protein [Streptomyces sp. NPDC020607]|uniref:hypothetical protein n=1 Tax=Streptomyces sp. NPDC020607 TaxID=3365082 RepID=UPI0037A69B90